MATGEDARRIHREVLDHYLRVFREDTGELLGYLADISIYGLMLQSQGPLRLADGQEWLRLRLELDRPLLEADAIIVDARPVWSRKEETSVFHHTGLELAELGVDDAQRVEALMEMYRLGRGTA